MAKVKVDVIKVIRKGAEAALDTCEYKGMTIRQWIHKIASGEYQPVKYGWWIREDLQNGYGKITCTCCGRSITVPPERYKDLGEYEKFCANCGAQMDGGAE